MVDEISRCLQVDSLFKSWLQVGGNLALSLYSSNVQGKLLQWLHHDPSDLNNDKGILCIVVVVFFCSWYYITTASTHSVLDGFGYKYKSHEVSYTFGCKTDAAV